MVLDKLPEPGRPTNLDYRKARAYGACSIYVLVGLVGHFLSSIFLCFLPLSVRRPDID